MGLFNWKKKEPAPAAPKAVIRKYKFNVAGTSFCQDAFRDLVQKNDDYKMSKKAIIDEGMEDEKIYEYVDDVTKTELIPDPDNPHDKNAIKVVCDGKMIGYVPKEKTKEVKEIIQYPCVVDISGGRFKYYDSGDETLEKGSENFFASVTVIIKETQ